MRNSYGRGTLPTLIEQNKIKLKKQLKISEIILEDFIMIPFLGINLTKILTMSKQMEMNF